MITTTKITNASITQEVSLFPFAILSFCPSLYPPFHYPQGAAGVLSVTLDLFVFKTKIFIFKLLPKFTKILQIHLQIKI